MIEQGLLPMDKIATIEDVASTLKEEHRLAQGEGRRAAQSG
jgi:hypothetical protein